MFGIFKKKPPVEEPKPTWLPVDMKLKSKGIIAEDIPVTEENTSHITVLPAKDDSPDAMKRRYNVSLMDGRRMEVEFRNGYREGLRSSTTQLVEMPTPENGLEREAWLLVRPEDPMAWALLNPDIVPLVRMYYKEMVTLDRAWYDSKPEQVMDKDGNVWIKAPPKPPPKKP